MRDVFFLIQKLQVRIEKSAGAHAVPRGMNHHKNVDLSDQKYGFGFRNRTDSLHGLASEAGNDGY